MKIGGLILGIWLLTAGAGWASSEDNFVLVVHLDNGITTMSPKDAQLIFLSKKRSWPNGKVITVVINENPEIYSTFSQKILKRSTRQYLIFRKKMLFRGQGIPPHSVKTDQEVIDFVASHHGSLGYISQDALTSRVKILLISP